MLGKIFTLIGLWTLSLNLWAISNQELIKNLRSRLHPLPHSKGKLIKSFTHHTQSYIYDQALAIIAFTKSKDQKSARDLLIGLKHLQLKDGSLYFSYYMDGKSPYPKEGGDKRFAGAISWVAIAAIQYQHEFKSKEFVGFNYRILKYLESQMRPFSHEGKVSKALRFAPKDIPATPWREDQTAALEHNLDAYAAFLHFAELNSDTRWKKSISHLKEFIMAMWDDSRSHFWSGADLKTGRINKHELYLDNQTWSLLALDHATLKKIDTKEALDLNCDVFLVEHEGITGFMDSKPTRRPASSRFVWSEGTAGQILAMKWVNAGTCKSKNADQFLESIKKMKKADGGIAYSTSTPNPDFTTASSVAGTAWVYFAANNFNPFQLTSGN